MNLILMKENTLILDSFILLITVINYFIVIEFDSKSLMIINY
jgi:hypothetical protein